MNTPNPKRPAAPDQPLWRPSYDAVQEAVGPPLEQFVRGDQFAQGLAAGHVGLFIGRAAQRHNVPAMAAWIESQQ